MERVRKPSKGIAFFLFSAASLFSAFAVSLPCLGTTLSVSAGASRNYIASTSSVVDGYINTGDFLVSGGVYGAGSSIVFDQTLKSTSKIVGKTKVANLASQGVKRLLQASFSLKLTSLETNGRFSFAFGLPRTSSTVNDLGVIEIAFIDHEGTPFFAVVEHFGEGIEDYLVSPTPLSVLTLGKKTSVLLDCTTDRKMTLKIGSNTVLDNVSFQENGSGFVGFFSSGRNVATIGDMEIYGYSYETPENVEYTEYFDDGHYNANVFYSSSQSSFLTPSYLGVDTDENGEGVLRFAHTGPAYISTRYSYSNFVTEFEIPWIAREAKKDEYGNYTDLISNWFGFAWGVNSYNESTSETIAYDYWLQFEGIPVDGALHTEDYSNPRYVIWEKGKAVSIQSMSKNFYSASQARDRSVFIKIQMIDGVMSMFQRYEDELGYGATPTVTYDFGTTPLGGLRIFTWALTEPSSMGVAYSGVADFTLDNWSIQNGDADAVKCVIGDPGYRENGITAGTDYEYTTTTDEDDLLGSRLPYETKVQTSLTGLWIGLGVGVGALAAGGAVTGVLISKKRRNKHEN